MNTVRNTKQAIKETLANQQLIEQAVSGNYQAREALAVASLPRVRKLVYLSYGNRNEIDDVVQIAMVTVFRDLPGLRNYDRFTAWLDTVVYNVVRTQGRKRVRFSAIFSDSEAHYDNRAWTVTPEDENIGQQLFIQLQGILDRIAYKKRTAAVMSLFFGYVDSEVATMMNCSIDTAKKRIQHGRKELIERIQKDPSCSGLLKEASV